jgi:tRNA nucleotidyltransferase (CCA-adding enzyme)
MELELFKVGGCVRDEILGLNPNDTDFVVEAPSFQELREFINSRGFQGVQNPRKTKAEDLTPFRFQEFPLTLTLKAKDPVTGEVCDFACSRREFDYNEGRIPSRCEVGSLLEDLSRRDFTFNAIAKGEDGRIIDPFHGRDDLENKIIRTVGDAKDRFSENPIRIIRALIFFCRFKDFTFDSQIIQAFKDQELLNLLSIESDDRKLKGLNKILVNKDQNLDLLKLLVQFPLLHQAIFSNVGLLASRKQVFI